MLEQQGFSFFLRRALVMTRVVRSKLLLSKSYFFALRHTLRGQEDGPCILGNYFLKIKILASFVFTQDHFLGADAVH